MAAPPFLSLRPVARPLTVVAVAVAMAASACSEQPPSTAPTTAVPTSRATSTTTAPPRTTPAGPALTRLTGGPVLAVKIDNTGNSRPRVGLNQADVVYVEPVEAGLTRLLAIFSTTQPGQVGPVRSARESDVEMLANYGRVAFAFSGASGGTLAIVGTGAQVNLSFDASRQGFRRDGGRPAPYDVIGSPQALLARAGGSVPPGDPGFRFGPASAGGSPATTVSTAWQSSRISLAWDAGRKRYLVTTDGTPDIDADGGQHGAATVVVQHVPTRLTQNRDVNGVQTPVVELVGRGAASVLRDGKVWTGQWARANAASPTSFSAGGKPVAMAAGPVWVLLVPVGQAVAIS